MNWSKVKKWVANFSAAIFLLVTHLRSIGVVFVFTKPMLMEIF